LKYSNLNSKSPEKLKIDIEKIVYGGSGFARTEYGVILVPYTIPGEHVHVSSINKRRGVLYGEIQDIIKPSENRVSPFCNNFRKGCGGCQWQHIDYIEQVGIKRGIVEESIERIGKETVEFPPLIYDPGFEETRLRSVFHISHKKSEIGFYRYNTNDIIPIKECPLCVSPINQVLSIFQENFDLLEFVDSVSIITSGKDVHLHLGSKRFDKEVNLRVIYGSINRYGDIITGISCSKQRGDFLTYGSQCIEFFTSGFKYLANGKTFFQGHNTLNGKLIEIILNMIEDRQDGMLLDLFCGVGFLSIPVASCFKNVVGIDNHEESIRLATRNAGLNGVANMEFFRQDLGLGDFSLGADNVDVVIVDPPRRGCAKRLIKEIIRLNPSQIIMVSCNPTTMARDIRILMNNGYGIVSSQGVDLFPQTFHIETIVNLKRKNEFFLKNLHS